MEIEWIPGRLRKDVNFLTAWRCTNGGRQDDANSPMNGVLLVPPQPMVRFRVEGTKWTIKGRVTTRGTMWKAWHPSISGLASRFSSRESDRGVTSSSAMVARARLVESDF